MPSCSEVCLLILVNQDIEYFYKEVLTHIFMNKKNVLLKDGNRNQMIFFLYCIIFYMNFKHVLLHCKFFCTCMLYNILVSSSPGKF